MNSAIQSDYQKIQQRYRQYVIRQAVKKAMLALLLGSLIVLLLVILTSCGKDKIATTYSGVAWEGYVNQDTKANDQYVSVKNCLADIGEVRNNTVPYLIITLSLINCSGVPNVVACANFDENIIYLSQSVLFNTIDFGHEVVHIVAQKYDENFSCREEQCSMFGLYPGHGNTCP